METHFAPAGRASEEKLAIDIDFVSSNEIMSGLLNSISGVLAVLNDQRQILAINDSFLKMLGINDPSQHLGLRPGEILQCVHAHKKPAGCGTTKFCSSCGAAVAIVSSLGQNEPVERTCALIAEQEGANQNLALMVRSHPMKIGGRKFLLLFLKDITQQQKQAALERIFFHDINNMLSMLVGASSLLINKEPSELATTVHKTALRLSKEVAIQRCLSQSGACDYQPNWQKCTTDEIIAEIQTFFASHPAARSKSIQINKPDTDHPINTDISLLLRVLCNMIINAFEASEKNGLVKVWLEKSESLLSFCVWNAQEIDKNIAPRIFQRNFTTKDQTGRGVGTYSMKLFGESILGGQVSFTTSEAKGTLFRYNHPL